MAAHRDPRANQKERTRSAIVEAATRILRGGATPSVAAAAEAAKVSRATAYRYFPTPESLHIEVAGITPTYAPVEQLVQTLEGDDVEARLSAFAKTFNEITFANEAQMRMALKVYLDTWLGSARPRDDTAGARRPAHALAGECASTRQTRHAPRHNGGVCRPHWP